MGPPTGAARLLGSQFLGYAVWFACLWLLLKIRYSQPFWRSLGWVIPERGMGLAMLAGPALALGLAMLAVALDTPHVDSPIEKLIADRRSLILVGIIASTVGPMAEELAFRGFMMPLLVRSFGAFFGIVATALPFALIHGPQYGYQWQNLLVLTLAACAFGWARLTFRSVIPAIVMHGLYNLTLFAGYSLQKDLAFRW
jgi:membrane protease YdiL (CAAX protease family)